jgi:chromosome partitioning protein
MRMQVLNFYNVKGGVGKSSLAYLSGLRLSQNNKVLFIDLDPQSSLTSIFTDSLESYSIYNYLADSVPLEDCIINYSENLFYIPSSIKVFKIQDRVLQNKLHRSLSKLEGFDYVIFDNSPNYSSLTVSSIQATDLLFIPTQISRFDFDSMVFTLEQAKDIKDGLDVTMILNRVTSKETREERLFCESGILNVCKQVRFVNQNSIRKLIANRDSLTLPKYSKLSESISKVLNFGIGCVI